MARNQWAAHDDVQTCWVLVACGSMPWVVLSGLEFPAVFLLLPFFLSSLLVSRLSEFYEKTLVEPELHALGKKLREL
jgi:hypothetical protein